VASRNPFGPLSSARLIRINETVFWSKTVPPDIEEVDDDYPYTLKTGDRKDLLAFEELGVSNLDWAIMHRNDMRLWPNDFIPGKKIMIPTRDSLHRRGIV
jgi:hypothetical protein